MLVDSLSRSAAMLESTAAEGPAAPVHRARAAPAAVRTLAFIDVGWRKLPFVLALREQLEPQLRCLYYTPRRLLRQIIAHAGAPLFPSGATATTPYPISDAELREALGAKLAKRCDTADLDRARRQLAALDAFFSDQQVDTVFVWNGYNKLCSSLAILLARRRGLRLIFGEHGYLPGTMQIDPAGVNQLSSASAELAAGRAFLPADAAIDAQLDALIALHRQRGTRADRVAAVPAALCGDRRTRVELQLRRRWRRYRMQALQRLYTRSLPATLAALPPRFVLLPLQVRSDSQLQLHSPVFGCDLPRLIRSVHEALGHIDRELRLVVKLHPREKPAQQAVYGELARALPEVRFTLGHPLPPLLEAAEAVITINSTVGFEAMLYDKPIVALGRNFYIAPSLLETVQHEAELPQAIHRALTTPPDAALRRSFLRWVCARFLVDGVYDDFSPRSQRAVAARILALSGAAARPSLLAA